MYKVVMSSLEVRLWLSVCMKPKFHRWFHKLCDKISAQIEVS